MTEYQEGDLVEVDVGEMPNGIWFPARVNGTRSTPFGPYLLLTRDGTRLENLASVGAGWHGYFLEIPPNRVRPRGAKRTREERALRVLDEIENGLATDNFPAAEKYREWLLRRSEE